MKPPFDAGKLDRLMEEAGLSLVLAHTRHNVRYLSGGYYYHFHANFTRMGRSQYLPFVGIPRGRIQEAFYVARDEERGQLETESPWFPTRIEAVRGTVTAAEGAVKGLRQLGLTLAGSEWRPRSFPRTPGSPCAPSSLGWSSSMPLPS